MVVVLVGAIKCDGTRKPIMRSHHRIFSTSWGGVQIDDLLLVRQDLTYIRGQWRIKNSILQETSQRADISSTKKPKKPTKRQKNIFDDRKITLRQVRPSFPFPFPNAPLAFISNTNRPDSRNTTQTEVISPSLLPFRIAKRRFQISPNGTFRLSFRLFAWEGKKNRSQMEVFILACESEEYATTSSSSACLLAQLLHNFNLNLKFTFNGAQYVDLNSSISRFPFRK